MKITTIRFVEHAKSTKDRRRERAGPPFRRRNQDPGEDVVDICDPVELWDDVIDAEEAEALLGELEQRLKKPDAPVRVLNCLKKRPERVKSLVNR